jgi:MYXO-CTERM domain-containing protein
VIIGEDHLMLTVIPAALIATIPLDGQVVADGGDYAIVEFEVPAGAVEIVVKHRAVDDANVLDFGVFDPDGFRGWGGGLTEDAIIGEAESSRGYLPGALQPGTWRIVIGKARLEVVPAGYELTVEIHDAASLTPRPRADVEPVVIEPGSRWYAGDFHVHSSESGDAVATFDEITAIARDRGLDFITLSDHNTVSQHRLIAAHQGGVSDLLFVRGNEVTTYGGHGNAVGAGAYIDHRVGLDGRTIEQIIADVGAAGGMFVVNHPRLGLGNACIGCDWDDSFTAWDTVSAIEIQTGPYGLAELTGRPARALWDAQLDAGLRITAVGGSDDHRAGIDLDTLTQSPVGSPTTLVFADELSEAAIIEAVRAGRVQVLLSGPDDPRVEVEVSSDSGELGRIGDSISGERLAITAQITGGAGGDQAQLVIDGDPVETRPIHGADVEVRWDVEVPAGGARYRVHVLRGGLLITVTNHVYVSFAQGPDSSGCGCRAGAGQGGGWLLVLIALVVTMRRRRAD